MTTPNTQPKQEINDGGPAFPMPSGDEPRVNATTHYNEGMSLRAYAAIKLRVPESGIDWLDDMISRAMRDDFAGQAMTGMLSYYNHTRGDYHTNATCEAAAKDAYAWADAMLAARKAGAE